MIQAFSQNVNANLFCIPIFFLFSGLVYVRKIQIFAKTHVFADVMIVLCVLMCVYYGIMQIKDGKTSTEMVPFVDKVHYTDSIGFAVYSFEGIGLILPIREITEKPEDYKKIVAAVIFTCCAVYIVFGYFCVCAWERGIDSALITDQLP